MEIQNAVVMRLPDGSCICITSNGGDYTDGNERKQNWMSVDISRMYPGGKEELIVSVDYEKSKGLRTLVYDDTAEDPIFVKEDRCNENE